MKNKQKPEILFNLKMATNDEIMRLFWDTEEEQDGRMYRRLVNEMNRRIKYDY